MECPICHQPQTIEPRELQPYSTQDRLFAACRVAFCRHCRSGWVMPAPDEPALKKYYDAGTHGWSALLGRLEKPVLTMERCQSLARWNFILGALKKSGRTFRSGRAGKISLCDIGAGYGTTLEVGRHLGLDIDFTAFESSKGLRKRIQTLQGKVRDDFFSHPADGSFDLIWASHILEHYPDPDFLLGRLRAMMAPNGIGFIEIPFLDNEFKPDLAPHLLFFTLEGLRALLARNGFQVLELCSAGILRENLKNQYQNLLPLRRIERWKKRLPKPAAIIGRLFYHSLRALVSPPAATVEEDLQDTNLQERWGLETYGGERSWIRAVVVKGAARLPS